MSDKRAVDSPPPILRSWKNFYWLVLLIHALLVAAFYWFTLKYK